MACPGPEFSKVGSYAVLCVVLYVVPVLCVVLYVVPVPVLSYTLFLAPVLSYMLFLSSVLSYMLFLSSVLLPARASEQGNVIGSVRIYIYVCTKKNCN